MPFGIGVWELAILLLVVLLVFGPKRLPEMGRSLGRGMREFKDSISNKDDDDKSELTMSIEEPAVTTTTFEDPSVTTTTRERDSVT